MPSLRPPGPPRHHHPAAPTEGTKLSSLSFFAPSFFFEQKFSLSEVFQGRWRESRKPKRIILLVKAFNNYF